MIRLPSLPYEGSIKRYNPITLLYLFDGRPSKPITKSVVWTVSRMIFPNFHLFLDILRFDEENRNVLSSHPGDTYHETPTMVSKYQVKMMV